MDTDVPRPEPGSWRRFIAWWPTDWRRKWADGVEASQADGHGWQQAEWRTFLDVIEEMDADEAEHGVGSVAFKEPVPSILDDAEAVSIILHQPWPEGRLVDSLEIGRRHNQSL